MKETDRVLDARYYDMVGYAEAWELQKQLVRQIDEGSQEQALLLLQHPPTYTIGSQRHPEHLLLSEEQLAERGISVFQIDRGGDITYHGPGQLVGYPLIYLDSVGLDLHAYLRDLEQVIIDWLGQYDIEGGRKQEYTGVWVGEKKIAAIGVKFNKCRHRRGFVTSHGFALNLHAGLAESGFAGIIPCGIEQYGVTSLAELTGRELTLRQAADEVLPHFCRTFGLSSIALEDQADAHH